MMPFFLVFVKSYSKISQQQHQHNHGHLHGLRSVDLRPRDWPISYSHLDVITWHCISTPSGSSIDQLRQLYGSRTVDVKNGVWRPPSSLDKRILHSNLVCRLIEPGGQYDHAQHLHAQYRVGHQRSHPHDLRLEAYGTSQHQYSSCCVSLIPTFLLYLLQDTALDTTSYNCTTTD